MVMPGKFGNARWGPHCPDVPDHGRLLTWPGDANWYCPHSDHTANGKFWTDEQVVAAGNSAVDLSRAHFDSNRQIKVVQVAHAEPGDTHVDRLDPGSGPSRTRESSPGARTVSSRAATPGTGPECLCGCGNRTKGGRFLPGHDARYHAAQKRAGAHA